MTVEQRLEQVEQQNQKIQRTNKRLTVVAMCADWQVLFQLVNTDSCNKAAFDLLFRTRSTGEGGRRRRQPRSHLGLSPLPRPKGLGRFFICFRQNRRYPRFQRPVLRR